MHQPSTGSLFYPLFSQVLNDKNLSHVEKLAMTLIYGLSDEEGKCYPSNEWLSEKLDIKERALQTILQRLEHLEYIQRELKSWENNPMKKYRIIYVKVNIKFNTFEGAKFCTVDTQKNAPILYKKEILDKKEEEEATPIHPPSSKRKSVKEESKEMASRVLITPSQHADLVKRAKDDEKLVQQWYDRLSQWKIGKEIEGGKDYSAITNWVIDAVKEKPSLQKPSESNKEWAIKKIDELNNMGAIERSRATVNVESESVSVSFKGYGPQADKFLKFSEHGFKDQLTNLFNKIGITMPNL